MWLDKLIRRQGNRCAFCRELIVRLARVQDAAVKITTAQVCWREGEDLLVSRIATLDHLKDPTLTCRLATDVVAACFTCNHARSIPPSRPTRAERRRAKQQRRRERRALDPVEYQELGGEA